MRTVGLLLLLLLARTASAAEPESIEQFCKRIAASDKQAIRAAAAKRPYSPWMVTSRLRRMGRGGIAIEYAAASDAPDAEALRTHLRRPLATTSEEFPAALEALTHNSREGWAVVASEPASVPLYVQLRQAAQSLDSKQHLQLAAAVNELAARKGNELGWLEGELFAHSTRFELLNRMSNYPEMLRIGPRILELTQRLGRDSSGAEANLGGTYMMLGLGEQAVRYLTPCLERFRAAGDDASAAQVQLWLANSEGLRGDYGRALALAEAILLELRDTKQRELLPLAQTTLGDLLAELGDREGSQRYYRLALDGTTGGSALAMAERAVLLTNLGRLNQQAGNTRQALRDLDAALATFEELDDRSSAATTLLVRGHALQRMGKRAEALAHYRDAFERLKDNEGMRAFARIRIVDLLLESGEPLEPVAAKEVDGHLRRAWKTAVRSENLNLEYYACGYGAKFELASGRPDLALGQARRALRVARDMLGGLADGETIGVHGDVDRAVVLEVAQQAAFAKGDSQAIADILEQSRSIAFVEALGGRGRVLQAVLPPALASEESRARVALAAARRRVSELHAQGRVSRAASSALTEAQASFEQVRRRIERNAKARHGDTTSSMQTLTEIGAALAEGEALVLFAVLPESAHALVIESTGPRVVDLEDPTVLCESLQLHEPASEADECDARLERLREVLVQPLGLKKTRRVLISPVGPLCFLPWPLLFPSDTEVALVPSGTSYHLLKSRPATTGEGVLALGDPAYSRDDGGAVLKVFAKGHALERLPESRDEIDSICLDRKHDVRLLGEEATEAGLRRALAAGRGWRSIHFACHGIVDRRSPQRSALALTPTDTDDGFLTALEIFGLDLRTGMVVLSACDTGRGKVVAGEGLVGLARSFLIAGAPRVVVSLWKADDEATRVLMKRFYEERHRGGSTSHALREAQRHVSRQKDWSHPYYWGGWVVWGLP